MDHINDWLVLCTIKYHDPLITDASTDSNNGSNHGEDHWIIRWLMARWCSMMVNGLSVFRLVLEWNDQPRIVVQLLNACEWKEIGMDNDGQWMIVNDATWWVMNDVEWEWS